LSRKIDLFISFCFLGIVLIGIIGFSPSARLHLEVEVQYYYIAFCVSQIFRKDAAPQSHSCSGGGGREYNIYIYFVFGYTLLFVYLVCLAVRVCYTLVYVQQTFCALVLVYYYFSFRNTNDGTLFIKWHGREMSSFNRKKNTVVKLVLE